MKVNKDTKLCAEELARRERSYKPFLMCYRLSGCYEAYMTVMAQDAKHARGVLQGMLSSTPVSVSVYQQVD